MHMPTAACVTSDCNGWLLTSRPAMRCEHYSWMYATGKLLKQSWVAPAEM
jgi:hypothetical protein